MAAAHVVVARELQAARYANNLYAAIVKARLTNLKRAVDVSDAGWNAVNIRSC